MDSVGRNEVELTGMQPQAKSSEVSWSFYWPLCEMIEKNDWEGVKNFVRNHPKALTDNISNSTGTIFHHLTAYIRDEERGLACLNEILESNPTALENKLQPGLTALDLCAIIGNTRVSKVFVKFNTNLPNIRDYNKWLAVQTAAHYGHRDTVQYLIQVTADENLKGESGALLISYLVRSNLYDVALDLLKQYPMIGPDCINSRKIVLGELSRKPLAFASGNKLGLLQQFIYNCIPVKKENISSIDQANKKQGVSGDVENANQRSKNYLSTKSTFGAMWKKLHMIFWNALVLAPYIKVIHETKLTHMRTAEILRMICEGVVWTDPEIFRTGWLHEAAIFGISEFVDKILTAYKRSVYVHGLDYDKRHVFHLAVLHRREKVFNLIYGFRFHTDMLAWTDKYGNNMLHLAGTLAVPSREVAGAALQMQRELQWFKAVESLMPQAVLEKKNDDNNTPRDVFTKTHKGLVKQGEKWMKETAKSCTLTAALIITVVFAAAFTVPGSNNHGGETNILKDQAFLMFAISDALALFSSITSLLMFLGILSSRYAEEDFLLSLPRKLIIGLITLFISIATMMVAFGATIYIVLFEQGKWIIVPISWLGSVPVTLFALLQFPLLLDMVLSTYGPSIFGPTE